MTAAIHTHLPAYVLDNAEQPKALVVFAHGAGAGFEHEFMVTMANLLVANNISVVRFNFPYMQKRAVDGKKRPPDRMPKLLEHYQYIVAQITALDFHLPIFLAGKSMGSRVAVSLLGQAQHPLIKASICLGYPFHPPKKPDNLRLEPLQQTLKPVLICQGERDALGAKEEIAAYGLSDQVKLCFLADGDHDLKPRKKSGFTHQQHLTSAVTQIVSFIDEHS